MAKKNNGISVNLISRQKLENLNCEEKLKFIIKEVKKGRILVLECGLSATEQANLIKKTMEEIEEDTFIGVEMEGYGEDTPTFIQKLLGFRNKGRLTMIGPADLVKTVRKDNNMIQTKIISSSK